VIAPGGIVPTRVDLTPGVAAGLAALPASAGVAEIEGAGGKCLLLTRSANIRKWAAQNLGAGPPPKAARRPKTDLTAVATAVSYVLTETHFERTLVFERWMAPLVPYAKRKDLRPPVFLRLDPTERFPRVSVVGARDELAHAFGPFRDRKAAERASGALHKAFPLRPCDHSFEPDAALPLGRSCLYAQVRSCAAPCLERMSEDAYRMLASDATRALASPVSREGQLASALPETAGAARGLGVVVSKASGGGLLHPVSGGTVLTSVRWMDDAIEDAVASLAWQLPLGVPNDWPWLSSWLHSPAGRRSFLVVSDPVDVAGIAAAIRKMA